MAKRSRAAARPRGITRIDQPSTRTHGYVVRLGWRYRTDGSYGPRFQAFFGDATHGGKKGARRAAEAWCATRLRSLKPKGGARKRGGRR